MSQLVITCYATYLAVKLRQVLVARTIRETSGKNNLHIYVELKKNCDFDHYAAKTVM